MILVVTHSKDLSADLVIRHLGAAKVPFVRLDTDRLGTPECHFGFSDRPTLRVDDRTLIQSDFGAIWARRYARPTAASKLDVHYRDFAFREYGIVMDAFLETGSCYQMNSYMADRLAGNRLVQSRRAAEVGLAVPTSCATQDMAEVHSFLSLHPRPVIKALSFGRLANASEDAASPVTYVSPVMPDTDWSGLAIGPVLLQERVEGLFEWRVTTVGKKLFAARTRSTGHVDWRKTESSPSFEEANLPASLTEKLLHLCHESNIAYGAHDLIETPDGKFVFLETNPAGQWGWLEATLGLPIGKAIAEELVAHHG